MKIVIKDDSIKLGQLLKKIDVINTGGEAKQFIVNNVIKINGQKPIGRGSKVKPGDVLWINDDLYKVVKEVAKE